MESKQVNNQALPNDEAVFELLTLTLEVDEYGIKYYSNKEDQLHRIHGPSVIWPEGSQLWYKNGVHHREDGPAMIYSDGSKEYWIDNKELTKNQFIQWQKDNGIKSIK